MPNLCDYPGFSPSTNGHFDTISPRNEEIPTPTISRVLKDLEFVKIQIKPALVFHFNLNFLVTLKSEKIQKNELRYVPFEPVNLGEFILTVSWKKQSP